MPSQLITDTSALFKDVYIGPVRDLLNNVTPFGSELESVEEGIEIGEPKRAVVPLWTGVNPAVGARGFQTKLPSAANSVWSETRIKLANVYARFYVPGQYLKADSDRASFGKFLAKENEATAKAASIQYNRMLHGDGTGVLADCGAMATPSLTVPVSSTQYLRRGLRIDLLNKATGAPVANGTNRKIASVNPSALTITLDGTSTVQTAATDAVYIEGSRNEEIDGILAMISDTNPPKGPYQEIDVATVPEWAAVIDAAAGADPSEDLWQNTASRLEQISPNPNPKFLVLTTHRIRDKFIKNLQALRRFTGDTMTLKGGWKAVSWNGHAIVADKDCVPGRTNFIDMTAVKRYTMGKDWFYMDQGGSIFQIDLNETDGYVVTLVLYANLATHQRNTAGAITGQSEA